ncbi:ArnT family glycosyltransferase [Methylotenera versatilis]|uniref:ArnT family glycosyltransferase n=1 Tax=Methylotenera versatilis TaxID=1055487 RepID=UPI0006482128|nr:glycosyl transferase [Methylotenera versatilis]
MRFDLDHDWQGNMSTPRARVGERAKTHLLLVLCAVWLFMGLIGHAPWKPFESHSISIIKNMLDANLYLMPNSAGSPNIIDPPLFYLSSALLAKTLQPILPLHDAARIATGLWMLITLLMIGMTGRELWGKGIGRQTTFVFMGSLGLIISAHTLTPEVASLTGLTTAFYALALSKRRPYRASVLLAAGMVVTFLSTGFLPILIILATCLVLPSLFAFWRSKSFFYVVALSIAIASPFLAAWIALCLIFHPAIFNTWWLQSIAQFNQSYHLYFLKTLLWYAWPALPLAIWGAWRYRTQLLNKPRFQLILIFTLIAWLLIGFGAERKDIYALPLLVPLTAMAGGSIETLKRGTAGALNWFGLILFGLMSSLIWLGWIAMMTGSPAKIKERLTFLSGMPQLDFNFIAVVMAIAVSLIWLFAIFRAQHSNRSSATNWAIGMTCVWTLLMTLWLPMIDSARSYSTVFTQFKNALPEKYACIISNGLGESQRDLLHYYTDIKTQAFETEQNLNCDLYLIQDEKGSKKIEPGADWKLIWDGKRISDRRESFRLFQRVN